MASQKSVDYYKTLGISRKAAPEEVTRAYRNLAKQYHPDKAAHLDDASRRERERQMAAINVAYSVMSSPRERQEYDLTLSERSPPSTARGGSFGASFARAADRPPVPPSSYAPPSSRPPVSTSGGTFSGVSPKPRYQNAGKYTQSSRQARRMDPSQYTVHLDGRASEFASATTASAGAQGGTPRASDDTPRATEAFSAPQGLGYGMPAGDVRNPSYVQRQLDRAREWERLNCPEGPPLPKYEWKAASRDVLRAVRERRQNRDFAAEEGPAVAAAA